MTERIPRLRTIRYFYQISGMILGLGLIGFWQANAQIEDSLQQNTETWYQFRPLNKFTLRSYFLKSEYPALTYRLENSDGDAIERGWNSYFSFEGDGGAFERLSFSYELEASQQRPVSLRKASVKLSDYGISFEVGRGSIWMGHGYHGSLLLSNNAEPFAFVKFQTTKPFRIPYIGTFEYFLFNGWPQDFKIIGQRLSWHPMDWLEIGGNQTSVYTANYKWWEFFRVFSAENANAGNPRYNTDMRASMDIAVSLKPLHKFFPFIDDGKIYYEYAGEDLYAYWQVEDKLWVGPLGFQFLDTGESYGLFLQSRNTSIRVEYSQDYRNRFLFHNFKGELGGYNDFTWKWYVQPGPMGFVNGGAVMGHHMGTQADDLFLQWEYTHRSVNLSLFYDRERHALVNFATWPWSLSPYPEYRYQYGAKVQMRYNNWTVLGWIMMNYYKNVSLSDNVMDIKPIPRRDAKENIVGLILSYSLDQ